MNNLLNIAKDIGWLDGAILLVILYLIVRGFIRGASGELSSLISFGAMAALFVFGFPPLLRMMKASKLLSDYPQASRFIAFILIAVAAIALWLLSRKLLAHSISLILPKPFDHVLGGIFGGISAVIVVALLCAGGFLSATENVQQQAASRSVFIEKLSPLLSKLLNPH
ncbi:MAG: CvpA family protein [Kiritimatiellaeota bacterium]|nr:CvpA family protein [Kiritimatiellota bacterium]